MRAIVVFSLLAACGGKSKPPAADPPAPPTASLVDCPKVAEHVSETVAADRPRAWSTHEAIVNLVTTRCEADAWNDETKQCLFSMKTIAEGRACATGMTDEQRSAIKTAARAMRTDMNTASAEPDDEDWIKHVVEEPPKK